jgi:hypothetical protein
MQEKLEKKDSVGFLEVIFAFNFSHTVISKKKSIGQTKIIKYSLGCDYLQYMYVRHGK